MAGHVWPVEVPAVADRAEEAKQSGLRAVDDHLRAPDASGVLTVRTSDPRSALAVQNHVARRLHSMHRRVVTTNVVRGGSCWRDASAQLGVSSLPVDPPSAARAIVEAAGGAVIAVLGSIPENTWDRAVLHELDHVADRLLVVLVHDSPPPSHTFSESHEDIFVGGTDDDTRAWWLGVVDDTPSFSSGAGLGDLDSWWSWAAPRMRESHTPQASHVGSDDVRLLVRLRLAGRAWPVDQAQALDSAGSIDALLRANLIVQDNGFLRPAPCVADETLEPTPADISAVAGALEKLFGNDPWALARAGELHMNARSHEHGDLCFTRALRAIDDAVARHDIWAAWRRSLSSLCVDERRLGALCAADLALDRDDVEVALELAHLAGGGDESAPFRAQLILGRAQLARGDVVAAKVSLDRAFARGDTDDERASALSLLAEASYVVGDLDDATRKARQAKTLASHEAVRLDASNTMGKVLLASAKWNEAEAHFAGDESAAAAAGLHVAQLRGRVNRAIALLSRGQSETARNMLESVLADGERRRDLRATAFALSNLAVLAIDRHDYANGLHLSERAIDSRRRLGDKVGLARVVTNLAELRVRLGLVREAEQTLVFGRQALRPSIPATRTAHFALVASRICLARGDTLEAGRQIAAALADAGGASDGAMVGECYRVEARIALEDGDVVRAERALRHADDRADTIFARAEVAVLETKLVQARGEDAIENAVDALDLVRRADDDNLLCEVHLLLSELYRIAEDLEEARQHLEAAKRVRDQVADRLPESLRARFLARRDLHRIATLDDALRLIERSAPPPEDRRPASLRRKVSPTAPRFVGQHPSVAKLLSAVQKVAATSSPVLVFGESGTGKELVAEALHELSDRSNGPLVKVNCAALVDTLLLSELFGHEKGAFTGASSRRRGRFEMAHGGTLFLDEIGDISPRTQVALLRVLQDHTFERVGGGAPLQSDVRIVCATHRDLRAMVADGSFREDLYYRLSGVTLRVPAVRDRLSDIVHLAEHLLTVVAKERAEKPKRLTPEALTALHRHAWPGNVRELDNVLRAASLFCESDDISADNVLEHMHLATHEVPAPADTDHQDFVPAPSVVPPSHDDTADTARLAYDQIRSRRTSLGDLKRRIERDCIQQALEDTGGNITRAATLLGMKRPRLSQLVKQYALLGSSSEEDL